MRIPKCPLCTAGRLKTPAELSMQACQSCASTIGLIPMPPSRRPPAPCARCNGRQFVRVIPREHKDSYAAPMFVTHAPRGDREWAWSRVAPIGITQGVGVLETYICRKCGAVEWYCIDVENIPTHPHLMSEGIDYDAPGETPYR